MTRLPLVLVLLCGCEAAPKPITPEDCEPAVVQGEVVNAATLSWSATSATEATLTWTAGEDPEQRLEITEPALHHEQALVGLPADAEVRFEIAQSDGTGCAGAFTTGPTPEGLPPITVRSYDATLASPEPYLLGSAMAISEPNVAFLIDREAGFRWQVVDPPAYQGAQATFERGSNRVLYTRYDVMHVEDLSSIQRRGLDGATYDEILTPGGHHFFEQHADGTIVYLATDIRGWEDPETGEDLQVVGDALMRVGEDGVAEELFTVWGALEVEKGSEWDHGFFVGAKDWSHGNAVDYDERSDTYLISLGGIDSLLIVSGDGELLEVINGETYTFVGAEPFVFQHDAHWTRDGTILMISHYAEATTAIEWAIDQESRTMTAVWSYADGSRATALGQARELENGNVMVNFGGFGTIREVTRSGAIAWEIQVMGGYFFGNGQMVTDLYAGE